MRNFLDNLIDRYMNAAPQITPRLPSIFESETSHSRLDLMVKEEATTLEETETLRQPPRAVQPVGQATIAERVRPIGSPAPTLLIEQGQSTVKVGLNTPGFPLSPLETPTSLPPSQEASEGRARVRGINEVVPAQLAASITPGIGQVRHTPQVERTEHIAPALKATAKAQPSTPLSLRETPALLSPVQEGTQERMRKPNEGLLTPSAPLKAPLIPLEAKPERPISRPERVINVTIGRIEVRATVSPQKQIAKPESRAPGMSLEEYLRRRTGGHDR